MESEFVKVISSAHLIVLLIARLIFRHSGLACYIYVEFLCSIKLRNPEPRNPENVGPQSFHISRFDIPYFILFVRQVFVNPEIPNPETPKRWATVFSHFTIRHTTWSLSFVFGVCNRRNPIDLYFFTPFCSLRFMPLNKSLSYFIGKGPE
jgi:hypothetical protein